MTTSTNVKVCTKCGKSKLLIKFHKDKNQRSGLTYRCKECFRESAIKFQRTYDGLSKKIYNGQIQSSKKRGHNAPKYSLVEFQKWLFNHKDFDRLFREWKDSGYETKFIPSVDRLKDELPYSFSNIQLVRFHENHMKQFNKMNSKRKKFVYKFNLQGKFIAKYSTLTEAARLNKTYKSLISMCCSGINKTAGGFKWSFVLSDCNR